MNELVNSVLGKHNAQMRVDLEISEGLLYDSELKAHEHIKRELITILAKELFDKKNKIIISTVPSSSYYTKKYRATLFAFAADEIETLMMDMYRAGLDARNIHE